MSRAPRVTRRSWLGALLCGVTAGGDLDPALGDQTPSVRSIAVLLIFLCALWPRSQRGGVRNAELDTCMQDCTVRPRLVAEIGRLAKQRWSPACRPGTPPEVLGGDGKEVATRYGKTYPVP
jgi:hypothetical protein